MSLSGDKCKASRIVSRGFGFTENGAVIKKKKSSLCAFLRGARTINLSFAFTLGKPRGSGVGRDGGGDKRRRRSRPPIGGPMHPAGRPAVAKHSWPGEIHHKPKYNTGEAGAGCAAAL